MSAAAIIVQLLTAYAPLTDLVPAENIMAGTVPAGLIPAVGVKEVGGGEQGTVARAGNSLVTTRVQVTVYAASYPQQKALLKAAGLGPGVHTGETAGFAVRSVLRDATGPDLSDDEAKVYEQSRDFKVTYIEPA